MPYTAPYTFTALELLTAAKMNAIQDNVSAIWVGTTAGDMEYYSSATAKTRVALGAEYKFWMVNDGGTAPEWGGLQFCSVYHSTTQVLTDGVATALTFDSESSDLSGWHNPSSNPSRITATHNGRYSASVFFEYAGAGGSGNYWDLVEFYINGSVVCRDRRYQEVSADYKQFCITTPKFALTAGQYVEVYVTQSSGGDKTVQASPVPRFSLDRWL